MSEPGKIHVAGLPVNLFTVDSLHQKISEIIEKGDKKTILHSNAHLCQLANTNEKWLLEYFNKEVDYVHCDGAGIQLAAKLTGQEPPEKIPYNTWLWQFADYLAEKGYSIYLLGAKEEVVNKAAQQLTKHATQLKVAGIHDGYFNKDKTSPENKAVLDKIAASKTDVLLVAFGMPIQEKWIRDNLHDIQASVIMCCGGAFDFISGNAKVAPKIFRITYMEWLYRMLREPGRLWKRYFFGNARFLFYVLKWGKKKAN